DAMTPTPTTDLATDEIFLSDPMLWARADRDGIFARLRAEKAVSFHREFEFAGVPLGPGFWAVTRYDDVVRVRRDSETFISGLGWTMGCPPVGRADFWARRITRTAPRHTKLRGLVNKGFTPRMVARIEEDVRRRARAIVDAVQDRGSCDFVADIAAALPLDII